jgi:heme-degrading monooxygenase HmoA
MIMRVWRGWTTEANAQAFELFLCEENFQAIAGFHGMSVLRLDSPGKVEFMTIMKFDSLDAVRAFAGDRYEDAVVPEQARAMLERFETRSRHYEVRKVAANKMREDGTDSVG